MGEPSKVDPRRAHGDAPTRAGVGARIRAARRERGMTLAQLAGPDLTPSFLSHVERGKSKISLRALEVVAQRLQLPRSYFLDDSGERESAQLVLAWAEISLLRGEPEACLRALETVTVPEDLKVAALVLQGRALLAAGRPREALPVLERAVSLAGGYHDPVMVAGPRLVLASALVVARSYDDALAHARAALAEAGQGPSDVILQAHILTVMGDALLGQGNDDLALASYERAVDADESIGHLRAQGVHYEELSRAYAARGATDNAQRYARMAVAALAVRDDVISSARHVVTLAERYLERRDFEGAESLARQALGEARELRAGDVERRARIILAAIALERGDRAGAEDEAGAALALAGEAKEDEGRAVSILAELAAQHDDRERADALYRQALEAFTASGSSDRYERTALAFGRLLHQWGDTERAFQYALMAAEAHALGSERSRPRQ